MKKDELRKVKYSLGQTFDGYFHCWLIKKDKEGSQYAVGLIEDTSGFMRELESKHIYFQD